VLGSGSIVEMFVSNRRFVERCGEEGAYANAEWADVLSRERESKGRGNQRRKR